MHKSQARTQSDLVKLSGLKGIDPNEEEVEVVRFPDFQYLHMGEPEKIASVFSNLVMRSRKNIRRVEWSFGEEGVEITYFPYDAVCEPFMKAVRDDIGDAIARIALNSERGVVWFRSGHRKGWEVTKL